MPVAVRVALTCMFLLRIAQSDKLMGSSGRGNEMLLMEKKEVQQLLKLVRSQQQ